MITLSGPLTGPCKQGVLGFKLQYLHSKSTSAPLGVGRDFMAVIQDRKQLCIPLGTLALLFLLSPPYHFPSNVHSEDFSPSDKENRQQQYHHG